MSDTQYPPDFDGGESLEESGADDPPYAADDWERLTPGAAFAKTLCETLPTLFGRVRDAVRRAEQ